MADVAQSDPERLRDLARLPLDERANECSFYRAGANRTLVRQGLFIAAARIEELGALLATNRAADEVAQAAADWITDTGSCHFCGYDAAKLVSGFVQVNVEHDEECPMPAYLAACLQATGKGGV